MAHANQMPPPPPIPISAVNLTLNPKSEVVHDQGFFFFSFFLSALCPRNFVYVFTFDCIIWYSNFITECS